VDDEGAATIQRAPLRIGLTRLNFGCGDYPLPAEQGWINIDETDESKADYIASVPPIPYGDETIEEVWGCHFLEHLGQADAGAFLDEAYRVLKPGGLLGLVVPDTRELVKRYIAGSGDAGYLPDGQVFRVSDLDDLCAYWLFSTVQPSHHKWAYELFTLQRLIEQHGFKVLKEIDRWGDPRLGTGQWYQCGWQAMKPFEP
jgi:SAM-dependent methyltransferase